MSLISDMARCICACRRSSAPPGVVTRLLPIPQPTLMVGPGSSARLGQAIGGFGHRKVLIVTDAVVSQLGLMAAADRGAGGQRHRRSSSSTRSRPTRRSRSSRRASRCTSSAGCDAIVAFGGGSVMDAAKAIGLAAANGKHPRQLVGYFRGWQAPPPIYAVPTTAGTGSEVTVAAVISDPEHARKLVIADTRIVPRMAALDPCLMTGLPPHITAATGMDALTHAVEAYIGGWGTAFTDRMALSAVGLIYQNLPLAFADGAGPGRAREDGAGLDLRRAGLHARQRRQRARHRAPARRPVPHAAWPGQRDHAAAGAALQQRGHPGQAGGAGRACRAGRQKRARGEAGAEVPRFGRGDEPAARHPRSTWTPCAKRTSRRWPRPPAGRPTPTTRCRGDVAAPLRGVVARSLARKSLPAMARPRKAAAKKPATAKVPVRKAAAREDAGAQGAAAQGGRSPPRWRCRVGGAEPLQAARRVAAVDFTGARAFAFFTGAARLRATSSSSASISAAESLRASGTALSAVVKPKPIAPA